MFASCDVFDGAGEETVGAVAGAGELGPWAAGEGAFVGDNVGDVAEGDVEGEFTGTGDREGV